MGLSLFQRTVCQLLARARVQRGESYLAGGATLNELLNAPRLSRDLDVFHDTEEALAASWAADRALLEAAGFHLRVFRERVGLVEAEVRRGVNTTSSVSPCTPWTSRPRRSWHSSAHLA